MPALETIQIPLGFVAPDFSLLDVVSGENKSLTDLKGDKATVMMFICNHCPYVKHIQTGLVELAKDYQDKGIQFVAVCSNDAVKYPSDSPEKMKETAEEFNYPFPYLYDETQEIAQAYKAVCTPDFSIFDADLKCTYRGQMDDSRPGNSIPVSGADIRMTLDAMLNGNTISDEQKPSIGCSIKWKNGDPYQ